MKKRPAPAPPTLPAIRLVLPHTKACDPTLLQSVYEYVYYGKSRFATYGFKFFNSLKAKQVNLTFLIKLDRNRYMDPTRLTKSLSRPEWKEFTTFVLQFSYESVAVFSILHQLPIPCSKLTPT